MLDLSLKELGVITKIRGIKDYKSMFKDKLLSILDKSEQVNKTKAFRDIRKENFNSDKILRNIRTLYESEEEDYYEPVITSNAFITIILIMRAMEIKIKFYQFKKILT